MVPADGHPEVQDAVELIQLITENLEDLMAACETHITTPISERRYVAYDVDQTVALRQLRRMNGYMIKHFVNYFCIDHGTRGALPPGAGKSLFCPAYVGSLKFCANIKSCEAEGVGFLACPPDILIVFVQLLWRTSYHNPSPVPGAKIYRDLMMERHFNIVRKILSQVMVLPPSHADKKNVGLGVLGSFLYSPEEELVKQAKGKDRCRFVRDCVDLALSGFQTDESTLTDDLDLFSLQSPTPLTASPGENAPTHISDCVLSTAKETLLFLRGVCAEPVIKLDDATWTHALQALLKLKDEVLHQAISRLPSSPDARLLRETVIQLLFETAFVCWVRSRTTNESLWRSLGEFMMSSVAKLDCVLDEWRVTIEHGADGNLLVTLNAIVLTDIIDSAF